MTAAALLGRPSPRPEAAVHLTLTVAQLDGLIALANHAAVHIGALLPDDERRAAAQRGLVRLRAAVQGLRANDIDQTLERLGEALDAIRAPGADELLIARAVDLHDVAALWADLERVQREAIRGAEPIVAGSLKARMRAWRARYRVTQVAAARLAGIRPAIWRRLERGLAPRFAHVRDGVEELIATTRIITP